ncbi:hypothetical protein [Curtobacterium sp. MCBD17_021]|uniref:hypothetical protein n=1 Tax=Curtobacterium sp. MCBD17_021 TaxID=2175665 RepID=UPI0015E8A6B4|nr:hypothetical protein [Curtobacterium sp. MCBD17_021]
MSTPIYDQLDADHESTVVIPNDVRVWTEDDHLTLADTPTVNGLIDEAGGLTL